MFAWGKETGGTEGVGVEGGGVIGSLNSAGGEGGGVLMRGREVGRDWGHRKELGVGMGLRL